MCGAMCMCYNAPHLLTVSEFAQGRHNLVSAETHDGGIERVDEQEGARVSTIAALCTLLDVLVHLINDMWFVALLTAQLTHVYRALGSYGYMSAHLSVRMRWRVQEEQD